MIGLRIESGGMRARLDWVLVGCTLGLVIIGSLAILSSSSGMPHASQIIQRHFMAFGLGILAFLFGLGFNYQIFQDQAKTLYGIALALLIAVLVVGETMRGQRSWFRFPYFSFQPSEAARILTMLVLADYLDKRVNKIERLKEVLGAFSIVGPVVVLILVEPDFSSILSFLPIALGMLFCAGANPAHLLAVAGFGAVALALPLLWTLLDLHPEWHEGSRILAHFALIDELNMRLGLTVVGMLAAAYLTWRFLWAMRFHLPWVFFMGTSVVISCALAAAALVNGHMKDYQRNRFVAFLAPEADPHGAGYNINQALVAIGSGGVLGKGVFSGTQSQLGFLPERHTDFVYAVVGEEMGIVGAGAVLLLYLALTWRVFSAARLSRDRYGYMFCSGMAVLFGFYLVANVGMCLGLLPVAGVPLPLVSYGGSSLVATLWALGIVSNVYSKRYAFI